MRTFLMSFVVALSALVVQPAHSQAIVNLEMGTYLSEPGESMDDFILRTAPVLDAFTAEKEWEACAAIAKTPEGDRYGFVLTSSQGMLGCLVYTNILPDGMEFAGMSVHSHPGTPDVHPTHMDGVILAMRGLSGLVRAGAPNWGRRGFSKDDYDAGPGYLVANGRVFFQAGRKTDREVGKLPNPAKTRSFPRR